MVDSRIQPDAASAAGRIRKTYYVRGDSGSDANRGLNWDQPLDTIQAAVNKAVPYDRILVAPGAYNETVTIAESKSNIVIVGMGGRGAAFIEPETAGAEGMIVLADDVTLINLGVAGDDTADYALQVGSQTVSPARFRAKGCKFELADGAGAAVILKGAGDVEFDDCEFAWAASGVLFDDNDDGFVTQAKIKGCRFHNLATVHVGDAASGGVLNLHMEDCIHDNLEDGTAPTDYVKVDRAGDTGIITGCRFATPTNEADVLTIAAGVMWVANYTEAGLTAARPS